MPIGLILVDDHPIVLHGLQQLFARQPDVAVTACCADAESAFAAIQAQRPDVLVLDLRMPGTDGMAPLRRLSDAGLACRTVLLTAVINDADVLNAIKLGVRGLVLKDSPPDTLVTCVRRVTCRLRAPPRSPPDRLRPR